MSRLGIKSIKTSWVPVKRKRRPKEDDRWMDKNERHVKVIMIRRGSVIYKNCRTGRVGSTTMERFCRVFQRMQQSFRFQFYQKVA